MPSRYYPFPPLEKKREKKKRLIAGYNKSSWKSSFFKVSRPARCAHTAPVLRYSQSDITLKKFASSVTVVQTTS